ncbi:MAG: sulfatase-like hydrolase/transferase [Saprospiraceae bacterium]|nr:sulfatase-like hydrolase/transferase [Saprospiraceae bacterium]MBK8298209.1 sulfatase-like hydrolase/transferase [Saprospiraceae bacterium]
MNKFFLPALLWIGIVSLSLAQQNVILIIADDMGTDYCGFYEDAKDTANMPNIRGLLPRGVRFTSAWANPLCSPTRAGMLTGRYAFRTGVGTALSGSTAAQLDTAEISIGKLLKNAAPIPYATANIGKWHLNVQTTQSLFYPNLMGFDHYSGNFLGEIPNYFDWKKTTNGSSPTNTTIYATTETVNDAIQWLDGLNGNQPFFLWLAFNAPHTPFHQPPAALHTVPGLTGTIMDINQNPKKYFRAMIEAMDTETGRLLQWLDQNGQLDSTNIIFIGDNGNARRVSQIVDTSQYKGTIYEYGIHVPFVIAGPAVESPGRVSDALVNTTDLFATILELAGFELWPTAIPADKPVDAKSLLPILKNQNTAVRDWNFSEQFMPVSGPNDGKTIRDIQYKLLHFDDGHQEFYYLTDNLLEQNDLLTQPLTSEATDHYVYLCTKLSQLIGTNTCNPIFTSTEDERLNNGLNVYPNPSSGIFYVKNSGPSMALSIQVFDMAGVKKSQFERTSDYTKIDISALPTGVYMLQVQHEAGIYQKLVVKY